MLDAHHYIFFLPSLSLLWRAPDQLDGILIEAADVVIAGLDRLQETGVAAAPVGGSGVAVSGHDIAVVIATASAGVVEGKGHVGLLESFAPAGVRYAIDRRELALDGAVLQLPAAEVVGVLRPDVLALHAGPARPQHVARAGEAREVEQELLLSPRRVGYVLDARAHEREYLLNRGRFRLLPILVEPVSLHQLRCEQTLDLITVAHVVVVEVDLHLPVLVTTGRWVGEQR